MAGVVVNEIQPGSEIFCYDDTLDGLLTAIFESYLRKPAPEAVVGTQHQRQLGSSYRFIETDIEKANRTAEGIMRTMGASCYESVWTAFLSPDIDKGDKIYKYVRFGMRTGYKTVQHITHPAVMPLDKLVQLVNKEAMRMRQFLRFSKMKSEGADVYYAKITPENDITAYIMPFFTDRFRIQPFIIHDTVRGIAGVFDTNEWYVTDTEGMTIPDTSADEYEYTRLWKRFYEAVAIRERANHRLRRQMMPKKFWKNMTEMQLADTPPSVRLPSEISRDAVTLSLSDGHSNIFPDHSE